MIISSMDPYYPHPRAGICHETFKINTGKCSVSTYLESHAIVPLEMQYSNNPEVFENLKQLKLRFLTSDSRKMKILLIKHNFLKFQKSSPKLAQNRVPAKSAVNR